MKLSKNEPNKKELQNVTADCRRLIENSIICWNYLYLNNKLTEMPDHRQRQSLLFIFQSTPSILKPARIRQNYQICFYLSTREINCY